MGALADLLNAQRRPEDEAVRITEALDRALAEAAEDDQKGPAETAAAVSHAYQRVADRIAAEKHPKTQAPDSAHCQVFDDPAPSPLRDVDATADEPVPSRTHQYWLLTETPTEPASGTAADISADEGTGTSSGTDADPCVEMTAESDGDDPSIETAGDHDDDGKDAESSADTGTDADTDTTGGTGEQRHDATFGVGPVVSIPSVTDSYAAAAVDDPWSGQEELDTYAVRQDVPSEADDIAEDGDESTGDTGDSGEVAPDTAATPPPDDIEEPQERQEYVLKERVRDSFSAAVCWAKAHRKQTMAYSGAFLAVVVAVGGMFSSISNHRGNPPLPPNTIAPATAASDNPERTPQDTTLIPAQVSASCGNDSDAVAPFSGNKKRAWVCNRVNGLDLNVLNITFAQPVIITSICIVPGWNYIAPDSRDEWARHRLAASVTWRMGGQIYPQKITPTRTGVCKEFPSVITTQMSMTITSTVSPLTGAGTNKGNGIGNPKDDASKVDETSAISSITIKGRPIDTQGN